MTFCNFLERKESLGWSENQIDHPPLWNFLGPWIQSLSKINERIITALKTFKLNPNIQILAGYHKGRLESSCWVSTLVTIINTDHDHIPPHRHYWPISEMHLWCRNNERAAHNSPSLKWVVSRWQDASNQPIHHYLASPSHLPSASKLPSPTS